MGSEQADTVGLERQLWGQNVLNEEAGGSKAWQGTCSAGSRRKVVEGSAGQ